jgi:hypothetical protein
MFQIKFNEVYNYFLYHEQIDEVRFGFQVEKVL